MVLSRRFKLLNDRFLHADLGGQSALRQLSEAKMCRCHACDPQGVLGERQVSACLEECDGSSVCR